MGDIPLDAQSKIINITDEFPAKFKEIQSFAWGKIS